MVWYNPMTWFSSETEQSIAAPMPMATTEPTPMGPYGGKKRKTRRAKKGGKKKGPTTRPHPILSPKGKPRA